jgi:hypothetical protein
VYARRRPSRDQRGSLASSRAVRARRPFPSTFTIDMAPLSVGVSKSPTKASRRESGDQAISRVIRELAQVAAVGADQPDLEVAARWRREATASRIGDLEGDRAAIRGPRRSVELVRYGDDLTRARAVDAGDAQRAEIPIEDLRAAGRDSDDVAGRGPRKRPRRGVCEVELEEAGRDGCARRSDRDGSPDDDHHHCEAHSLSWRRPRRSS